MNIYIRSGRILLFLPMLAVFGCQTRPESRFPNVQPPVARVQPYEIVSKHGHKRTDDYYWLKNREDSAVVNYLKAENDYLDTMLAHTKTFQEKLFAELKGRIKEDDQSVPSRLDNFYYYTRYEQGSEYPIFCRKKGTLDAPEEIMADGNALGREHAFFQFYAGTSPDHHLAHLIMDTVGRRFYTVKFKDLNTGKMLADKIGGTTGNIAWANDNKALLFVRQDPITLRPFRIYRHVLGTDTAKDQLLYEEKDQTLAAHVYKTRSRKYFIIGSGRTDASENRFLEADHGTGKITLIEPLQKDVSYSADHVNDKFYIRTNLQAKNYRLVEAPAEKPGKNNWKDVIPHRADVFLEETELFKDYLALSETREGLTAIRLVKWSDQASHNIDFTEAAYVAGLGDNPDVNATVLRYNYQSMTTPPSVYDYTMDSHAKKLLKQREVLGGFDPAHYETERVMVTARDGVKVPLSIVYRKGFQKDGAHPGLIYGYGSYGYSMDPSFSSSRLSLLDRGFVYAIAHIRGGQEMGGEWYEHGKMLNKKNTFNDFVDCSKFLLDNKYVGHDKLFAQGGSAGGLLMGAITNMNPELYKCVIADVPFVDVMTTMMDESIPLTTGEWNEWGNPAVPEQYDYMLSYSPYDNVTKKDYPNMLVTTGLHDSQVQYWEPSKWVAKLRAMKTDKNIILLHTNMDAGHGGASGRFKPLKQYALQLAFMMELVGMGE